MGLFRHNMQVHGGGWLKDEMRFADLGRFKVVWEG